MHLPKISENVEEIASIMYFFRISCNKFMNLLCKSVVRSPGSQRLHNTHHKELTEQLRTEKTCESKLNLSNFT